MKQIAIIFVLTLFAAGCRAGFPNLNDAPQGASRDLVTARDAGVETLARIIIVQGQANASDVPIRSKTAMRPRRLLASLPVGAIFHAPGVIDRAVAEAVATGRTFLVVIMGERGRPLAAALATALRRRGMDVEVSINPSAAADLSWVELYLAS